MRVAVTAGYSQSLHAIALIHRLAQRGHTVALVLQVRMLSRRRLSAYLRQLGWHALWSKARSRLAPGGASPYERELEPMRRYLAEHQIASRTVAAAARAVGARHAKVGSLNNAAAHAAVRSEHPELILYAGGGIIRDDLLTLPARGIINAHGGPLPEFRGMNAVEWPLLHGVPPAVTVYRMDGGLDTGSVLLRRAVDVPPGSDVLSLRGVATRIAMEALLDTVDALQTGSISPVPQEPAAGRQYFVMAAPLVEVLDRWLRTGRTPLTP